MQPHATAFGGDPRLLERSLFVSSDHLAERVWAIDLALRCPGVGVVIADGSGLGMRDSRRLQLAASSEGALCLLGRPWREQGEISAAWTRWLVRPKATPTTSPHWSVQLLRCKGSQASDKEARQWTVRRDHETNDVGVVPELRGRVGAPARSARRAFG
ncbi:MAG: ImuA family protein [Phycisphaerales bacterium JB059]